MSTIETKENLQAFSERLKTACDNCPSIPAENKGRQTYVAKHIGVSQEAARKWFSGDSMPRKPKMDKLVALLSVDYAWLALGIKPELDMNRKKLAAKVMEGSVMVVAGILRTLGAACSFPDESNNRNGPFTFTRSLTER